MSVPSPIFVAGTGRSGTSQLADILGLFERLGVDDFATKSTFQARLLKHRQDRFDPATRELIERTLDGVIPAMGYA